MPQGWTPVAEPAAAAPAVWTRVPEADPRAPHIGPEPESRGQAFIRQLGEQIGPPPGGPASEAQLPTMRGLGPNTREALNTPLARPTGIDAVDSILTPANLATMGAFGLAKAIAGAATTTAGGAVIAGAKEVASHAAPQLKYEAVKSGLEFLHVPRAVAIPIALYVSGKRVGKAAAPAEAPKTAAPAEAPHAPTAAGYSRYEPSVSGYQPPVAEPVTSPVESAPGGTAPRADPLPSPSPVSARTAANPKLTAVEFRMATAEYQRLRRAGKTDAEAQDAIAAALEMQKSLGLKTPTDAQTKFPKGMRGKAPAPKGSGS